MHTRFCIPKGGRCGCIRAFAFSPGGLDGGVISVVGGCMTSESRKGKKGGGVVCFVVGCVSINIWMDRWVGKVHNRRYYRDNWMLPGVGSNSQLGWQALVAGVLGTTFYGPASHN